MMPPLTLGHATAPPPGAPRGHVRAPSRLLPAGHRRGAVRPGARAGSGENGVMENRNPVVDAWFETYVNPQIDLVQAVRRVILGTDPRITETIKWKAPTFMYRGNLASFYPKSAQHVSLMFHRGAALPDPTGLLEGDGDTSRVARFHDREDLAAKEEALRGLVRAWIEVKA